MRVELLLYRIGNYFYKKKFKIIGKLFSLLNRFIFSSWIPSSSEIGKGTKLGYWGLGIVIHSNTKIGEQCNIGQNVTIGRNFGDKKVPIIGDFVYVGAGSVIFGEIKIGDNVIIGANSVINKSIPNNCTVVGNPFRIIKENRQLKYFELDT